LVDLLQWYIWIIINNYCTNWCHHDSCRKIYV